MKHARLFSEITIVSWAILLLALLVHIFTNYNVTVFCQYYQFILDTIIVLSSYKIYLNSRQCNSSFGLYIFIATIGLFILNILYFTVYSVPHLYINSALILILKFIYHCGIIIYHLGIMILFAIPIFRYILNSKQITILVITILTDIVILRIFSVSFHHFSVKNYYFFSSFFLVRAFLEMLFFNLAILLLVYAKNLSTSLIASGAIITTAANFMNLSCHITKIDTLLNYAELLWTMGIIVLMSGIIAIIKNKSYDFGKWFKTSESIKSRLIFCSFSVAFMSIILFFIIVQQFSIISITFFVFSPSIIMCYALVVALFSILIGNAFEQPFKQIQNNIESMLINDTKNINANFTIDEFTFLQKHLVNTLQIKEEKDKVKKMFGETAATVAHDIASPINAMAIAIASLKKQMVKADDIALLETSMQSVRDISRNLLVSYRSLDDHNTHNTTQSGTIEDDTNAPRYIILATLIENIIASKRIEWQSLPCNIVYQTDLPGQQAFAYVSPLEMSRTISNLLNNAYESLNKVERNILLTLSILDESFVLSIKDLAITFPVATAPSWSFSQINYTETSVFAVLDDDPAIIMLWQRVVSRNNLKAQYFFTSIELKDWLLNSNLNKENIILLTDYSLGDEEITGIDVIFKFNITNSYLFTNHAEEIWLQNLVANKMLKLCPKSLIETIKLVYNAS